MIDRVHIKILDISFYFIRLIKLREKKKILAHNVCPI